MEKSHQISTCILIASLYVFAICFSGCGEDIAITDIDIPFGETIFVKNGERLEILPNVSFVSQDTSRLAVSFSEYISGHLYDKADFYITLEGISAPANFGNYRMRYITTIDVDQPGYEYDLVSGTEYAQILSLDLQSRIVKMKFGATYTRTSKNRWVLDLPYRIECHALIHTTIRE